MSGKLDCCYSEMEWLLALDSNYVRPGYTMDMPDCMYLYLLIIYSILLMHRLGLKVNEAIRFPDIMVSRGSIHEKCSTVYARNWDENDEVFYGCSYYNNQWLELYETYDGNLSKKNALSVLSDLMSDILYSVRKMNGLGLWTVFSEAECRDLYQNAGIPDRTELDGAVIYFMDSLGSSGLLQEMGIEVSEDMMRDLKYETNNILFVDGFFALTSAWADKIARASKKEDVINKDISEFLEKCHMLDGLFWRAGSNMISYYTNVKETVTTRTQLIGTERDTDVISDYLDISSLLPIYLYYLEKAAVLIDEKYFGGRILKEADNGR